MKDYKHIEHMRNLNDSLIWERMKRCYDYGYEDGQKEKPQAIYEMKDEEYNKGLNEAWECARKITGGEYDIELSEIFGNMDDWQIIKHYSASEAIAKLKAFEQKQKCKDCNNCTNHNYCDYEDKQKQTDDIKVGYEVYNLDPENKRLVTAIDGDKAIQLCSNGKYTVDNIDTLHWTGRHFDEIKDVFDWIRWGK